MQLSTDDDGEMWAVKIYQNVGFFPKIYILFSWFGFVHITSLGEAQPFIAVRAHCEFGFHVRNVTEAAEKSAKSRRWHQEFSSC